MRWSDYFILAPTTCRLQQHWNYRRSRAPVMFVHCTAARRHRRLLAFNLQRYSEVQALQWTLLPELWQSQYQWVAVIVPVAGCDTKGLPSTWEWGDKTDCSRLYTAEITKKVHLVHTAHKVHKVHKVLWKIWDMGRVHTVSTIEAAAIRTPPRVDQSHEGSGGRLVGPDMRCIDCSFLHFSLSDLVIPSGIRGRIGQKSPIRPQRGAKIILEARSAGTVWARRVWRDPDSIFCAEALRKRGLHHVLNQWQLFSIFLFGLEAGRGTH